MNDTARTAAQAQSTAGWGSDAIAELLRALEIPYIALTPGASFRGLHDSLVNYLGNTRPEMLLCVHEESAVALAHGYARVTGKPLAVALHANVGLMHATMAIFNAWCDRIPDPAARRRRAARRDEAAAVGRLDPHLARPGRARARLHQVGRPAGLGAGGARSDPARASHRDDAAAGTHVTCALDAALQEEALAAPVPLPQLDRFPAPRRRACRASGRCARSRRAARTAHAVRCS